MTDLITIAIPTYRRPALLRQTLLSCYAQDYRPLEIDIGDDSTDDGSEHVVQSLPPPDGITVRYWRNTPGLGQAGNVNRLFAKARGERLVLMHDDDMLLPGAISAMASAWNTVPGIVAVYGLQQILNDDGELDEIETEYKARFYKRDAAHAGEQREMLVSALWRQFPNNGYLIETAAARRVGYRSFEEVGHACDTDFSIRLAMQSRGRCFYMIDTLTSQYRYNVDSLSRTVDVTWKLYDQLLELHGLSPAELEARDDLLRQIAAQATKENALRGRRRAAMRIFFSPFYPRTQTPVKSLYHLSIMASPRAVVLRRFARLRPGASPALRSLTAAPPAPLTGPAAPPPSDGARVRDSLTITIVSQNVRYGHGQGRANLELAREALRCGHRVNIVASEADPAICRDPNVKLFLIDVRGLSTQLLRDAVFDLRAQRIVRKLRPTSDIVHINGAVVSVRSDVNTAHFVHDSHAKFHSGGVLALLRSPYRSYQYAYTLLNCAMERRSFRRSRRVIAVSQNVANDLIALGVEPRKIVVIYNGIDLSEFRPGRAERGRLGLPADVPLGLFVGDITGSRKNLDSVLRAMVTVESLHLVVLANVTRSTAPALAESLGVADRVHFLGERGDVGAVMRSTDMLIFPSRYEPFGMVILEAMASSLPVITSRSAGAAEIIEDGSGIVIEDPNDVSALAEAISRLVADPALRREMGRQARRVAERHSWEEMARRYLLQYRMLAPAPVRASQSAASRDDAGDERLTALR